MEFFDIWNQTGKSPDSSRNRVGNPCSRHTAREGRLVGSCQIVGIFRLHGYGKTRNGVTLPYAMSVLDVGELRDSGNSRNQLLRFSGREFPS